MKILSFNCNGIRASLKKGLASFIEEENPDIFCLQETKASPDQCSPEIWKELGYTGYHHTAMKPGYSSVAIFTKSKPKSIKIGIDHDFFDQEGRSVGLDFGKFYIWNVYFPSGISGQERQDRKMEFLDYFQNYSKELCNKYKKILLCGDVNIANHEIDIHNPKGNAKNSGFLPEERKWLTDFLDSGWVDSFRYKNPEIVKYSWWTYRFNARSNNKGWRIDYFFVTDNLKSKIQEANILTQFEASDHAPILLEMKI
ncbi:exodeoxyribonuclease III [Leptospira sp. GIMC2001]|uniref:exodeoxyribonuclease III n=1 Tax=Leptospira sp. GIMC2001 TaxID=1513297 RepID=UPI00234ACFB7|nr:exodeoxyribonuclease III [Leptospira sp. GIMC2001]WCL48066.1 exodeoxyribonuclease III [Leptospira sp. GIMC2001]